VLGPRPATALDPHTRITQYFHTAWRAQDGAFGAAQGAVTQTAEGYIWIGIGSGLVKYDGARFEPWTPPPGKSLPVRMTGSWLCANTIGEVITTMIRVITADEASNNHGRRKPVRRLPRAG
jgi:ligand-binding sensor domain-containing protein